MEVMAANEIPANLILPLANTNMKYVLDGASSRNLDSLKSFKSENLEGVFLQTRWQLL